MAQVVKTPEFEEWFQSLRDQRAKAKILSRIDRLETEIQVMSLPLEKASAK